MQPNPPKIIQIYSLLCPECGVGLVVIGDRAVCPSAPRDYDAELPAEVQAIIEQRPRLEGV